MAEYLIQDTTLTEIADAIRAKTGGSDPIVVSDMAGQIGGLSSESDTEEVTVDLDFATAEEVILAEQTTEAFFLDSDMGMYFIGQMGWFSLQEGETYRVLWDGEEHTCVAYSHAYSGYDAIILGNEGYFKGESTDIVEPFVIYRVISNDYCVLMSTQDTTSISHTVAIYQVTESMVVEPSEDGKVMSKVTITKPDALIPENIAKDVEIAGVVGNASLADFDSTDENLKYLAYHVDMENKEVIVRNASMYARNAATGVNAIVIPNKLGGYPVAIDIEYGKREYTNSLFGNTYLAEIQLGEEVRYVNGNMSNLVTCSHNYNNPIPIPNGVTNMQYAVYYCNNFNQCVNIPDSVVNMYTAFGRCANLNQPITLGNNIQQMYRAFYNCFNLNQPITIPNSVTHIGEAFSYCYKLNAPVVIGSGVTNACMAFYKCTNLGGNMNIYANEITNARYLINGKNNSIPINIFVHAGSTTETTLRIGTTSSIVGTGITWTNNESNNCFYNTTYNIYVYNNL